VEIIDTWNMTVERVGDVWRDAGARGEPCLSSAGQLFTHTREHMNKTEHLTASNVYAIIPSVTCSFMFIRTLQRATCLAPNPAYHN
jgi:hypothetical protein